MHIDTKVIHEGEDELRVQGAVALPIFQSSTYAIDEHRDYHAIKYLRLNNSPNHILLHKKLAALEGGEDALVTGSGMAAISAALLTVLKSGDHLIAQNCLYGGTNDLIREDLKALDIDVSFVDLRDVKSWSGQLRPNSKAFYVESLTNPLLQVGELQKVTEFCRSHKLISLIDNTFCSPYNFQPLKMGYDLSLHSATKYLNGHSDIVAGAVIGRKDLIHDITKKLNHLGGCLDAHACYLLNRGLKTLSLRVERQNANAMGLAQFLEKHPRVESVIYPGLPNHPDHGRAREWFKGFGGMVSFELKGDVEDAELLISKLKFFLHAPSLGGVESLIIRPVKSSHAGLSPEDRKRAGISDRLVRVSVGIENLPDLIEDFTQALKS